MIQKLYEKTIEPRYLRHIGVTVEVRTDGVYLIGEHIPRGTKLGVGDKFRLSLIRTGTHALLHGLMIWNNRPDAQRDMTDFISKHDIGLDDMPPITDAEDAEVTSEILTCPVTGSPCYSDKCHGDTTGYSCLARNEASTD